ncbi:MAG: hypothetical protein V2A76_14025 [Planctomycetota bacterium]
MKPPTLPSGRRPSVLPTGGLSVRVRLISLLAMTLLFAAGFLYIRYQWSTQDQVEDKAGYVHLDDLPRIVRDPAAKIDFKLLESVQDETRTERLIREPEAYSHLLGEARKLTPGDLEALNLKRADAKAILEDPAQYRGEPLEVKGTLEQIEVVQGQLWQEIRGRVRDQEGQIYSFAVLKEPNAEVGQVVRLQGFFFKLLCLETAPGEYTDNVICLVGRSLVRSFFEMKPTSDLSQAPFHETRDYDLTDRVELQEGILYHILSYVRSLSDEQKANLEFQDVTWSELRRQPDQYRGKTVRILVRYVPGLEWPRKLGPDGENPLDVRQFQDGILALPRNRLIRWIGFEEFPRDLAQETKLVYLVGVFYKVFAWENTRGEILNGPLLVPIRFSRFTMPRNELIHQIGYGIAGACLILVLFFLVSVFRDGRRSREFRRQFLRRKRRRLEIILSGGDESGSPSSDASSHTPDPPAEHGDPS